MQSHFDFSFNYFLVIQLQQPVQAMMMMILLHFTPRPQQPWASVNPRSQIGASAVRSGVGKGPDPGDVDEDDDVVGGVDDVDDFGGGVGELKQ